MSEHAIVNFTYEHTREGKRIRQRGTQIRLTVNRLTVEGAPGARYIVGAIGDELQGKGSSLKNAILDYLRQSNLV